MLLVIPLPLLVILSLLLVVIPLPLLVMLPLPTTSNTPTATSNTSNVSTSKSYVAHMYGRFSVLAIGLCIFYYSNDTKGSTASTNKIHHCKML